MFAVDKDAAWMAETLARVHEVQGDVTSYTCDVTDAKAIAKLVADCVQQ